MTMRYYIQKNGKNAYDFCSDKQVPRNAVEITELEFRVGKLLSENRYGVKTILAALAKIGAAIELLDANE